MIKCLDRALDCRVPVIHPAIWQPSKAQRSFKSGMCISSVAKTMSGIHLGPENSGLHGFSHIPFEKERASISIWRKGMGDGSKEGGGWKIVCVSGWRCGWEGGNCWDVSLLGCSSKKNSMKWLSKLSEWHSPEYKFDSRKPKSGDLLQVRSGVSGSA